MPFRLDYIAGVSEEGIATGDGDLTIDIEYNKKLDHQRPCLEDDLSGGSNNIVQSNKSV